MEKQYNEELVMHLVKALESALPAGMSVLVVGGSPELSEKEAMQIIHDLSAKTCGRGVSMASIRGYGENQEWIPDDEEEDEYCEDCLDCECYYETWEFDDYDCPEEEEEEEEPSANTERIRELLEEVTELVEGL